MLKYFVKWTSITSGEIRRVDGDYMSCAVAYSAIQHDPDVKDCTFGGPIHVEEE